ncbi:MAG: hypothetical protein F4Y18_05960 [Cenarchaeum sp. SB0663_bin_5]|nr:hypothetical protein [Cenarchaeum sp. SB0663_bin_5]MYH03840.1 hypothetical protein [Cenarchaeum sp. SB0675_bin_21]
MFVIVRIAGNLKALYSPVKLKSNILSKSYGSHSWRVMGLSFMQNKDELDRHYQSSRVYICCPEGAAGNGEVAFVPVGHTFRTGRWPHRPSCTIDTPQAA